MTSVVVWKNQESGGVWAASDSRYSRTSTLTDQAQKLLPLHAAAHRPIEHGGQAFWEGILELKLGFAFAGAVVPAMVTHSLLAKLLASVGAKQPRLPSLQAVATLAADVAIAVIKEVGNGYGSYKAACFEFAVFGSDVGDAVSVTEYGDDTGIFHGRPDQIETWPVMTPRRVDSDGGEVLVMGTKVDEVRDAVLARDPTQRFVNFEPADVLADIIAAGGYADVGGYVQVYNPVEGLTTRPGMQVSTAPTLFGYDVERAEELLGLAMPLLR